MKIVMVSNLYGDNARGGAERIVASEVGALTDLGQEVVVVRGVESEKRKVESAGNKTESCRLISYLPPNYYFYTALERHGLVSRFFWHLADIFNAASARKLRSIIECEKPDAVHTHNLMGLGFMIPRMLRRLGLRHVHTVHDVQLLHPSGLLATADRLSLAQRVYVGLMRRLMGSPNVVFFPSQFLADLHDRFGFFPQSKKVVLRNPSPETVDAPRFVSEQKKFLFAGQLERHKGIDQLLDVWGEFSSNSHPGVGRDPEKNTSLEIAGAGSLASAVQEQAKKMANVKVLGKLNAEQMQAALLQAAFIVMPSRVIENAPAIIMESYAAGTPVIAAAIGGIPELVKEGETGFLFTPGDAQDLARAVEHALANAAIWEKLSNNCRRFAEEHSRRRHGDALVATYKA